MKLVYLTIILLIVGILLAQLQVIPNVEVWQERINIAIFLIAIIVGIGALFKIWKGNNQSLIKSITSTVIMISAFGVSFLGALPDMTKPEYIKEIQIEGKTLYVYHTFCFVPDSACECNNYGSLIFIKNAYLPIRHLLTETDFYVDDIELNKGDFIAKASDTCSKDSSKTKTIAYK